MLHTARTVCVMLLVAFFVLTRPASAVQSSKPAPDFTLTDINGKIFHLSDYKGNVVILNFWSTTCAPCVAEIPELNTLYRELKASGLVVVGISLDRTLKPVKEMAEKQHITYPLLMDSQQEVYFDTYALFGQPVSIVVDRAGVVREKLIGQVAWASPQFRVKITDLLKGR